MPLLGSIVKSAIALKHNLTPSTSKPTVVQKEQLEKLLEKAANTSFGIYHGFAQILNEADKIKAFRKEVPIYDYDTMHRQWWKQQQRLPNITWPGKPHYFALSSGTTGKESKRIPVTDDMLAAFRSVGIAQVESLANFDLPAELFEKDVLMLSSSADLDENNGHLEGEISGINTSNLPSWFGGFYKPGIDIAQIDDWDKRVKAITKKAPTWDVAALAGIPSWIQMLLEHIIEAHQLESIHDIWPNLSIYASGGVAFEPYRESLNKLMGKPMTYLDTYLASEGFLGFTARPGSMDMELALDHGIFYEFIPFDERGFDETGQLLDEPMVLSLDEVQIDQDYALLISTPAGAWRYMIGDTIKFSNLERYDMHITGRTKYFLNVVGSQLSEEKMNDAITQLASHFDCDINEFGVAALPDESEKYFHQWVLGTDAQVDPTAVSKKLDELLKELNKNYKVARRKALTDIKVKMVPTEQLYNWLESTKKKGGQIKMPKVMKTEKMQELLAFLS